jgi:hypothetical protein
MIAFPSIEQFKHLINEVVSDSRYSGRDEHGNSIWNNDPLPILDFVATTKCHGCVHKDTLVTLADGSQEKISNIPIGTSILSYNELTKEIEFDVVNDVIVQDLEKKWIRLDFDNGTYLKCTTDHPILTSSGWISAEDLTSEHEIIIL